MELFNDPAARRIREAADRGTLSHALLFSGSGDRLSAARFAAAAMECQSGRGRPCGACAACRKVFTDIHPDVVTVRDEAHKNLSVDTIRQMRADAYVQPNGGHNGRLRERMGHVEEAVMEKVDTAIAVSFGLPHDQLV